MKDTITVAYGDGIGPEIMRGVLKIIKNTTSQIEFDPIEIGKKVYEKGFSSGISSETWNIIKKNKILLKAPITTPLGEGYKSLNVSLRRGLCLFANIRPSFSYYPFIGKNTDIDTIIFRENEEDLYSGIEYKLTHDSAVSLKLVSEQNSWQIVKYAFEYAKLNKRKKVTCITKSNIMKMSDGIFQKIFNEVSQDYPEIKAEHMLVDIASAKLASTPKMFDVIVTLNLYGDILSDIAAEISGSVGLAGSANIGKDYAMFEAVHGAAPDIAEKNIANPSGLLNSAVMMLKYMKKYNEAQAIHDAWIKTIQSGVHTKDIVSEKTKKTVSTTEFVDTIISNLSITKNNNVSKNFKLNLESIKPEKQHTEELIGVDLFLKKSPHDETIEKLNNLSDLLKLHIVSSRGMVIWPKNINDIKSGFYRYRFIANGKLKQHNIVDLVSKVDDLGFKILLFISLHKYNEEIGYSLAQGE